MIVIVMSRNDAMAIKAFSHGFRRRRVALVAEPREASGAAMMVPVSQVSG